jgi:hypothetical protein
VPDDRPYQHPGYAFLQRYGSLQSEADLLAYVAFLREEAKLGGEVPTPLSKIYGHFGMPEPKRVPLEGQQGILLDSDRGLVLIRADDSWVRQRFTEGHELMEFLFDAQVEVQVEPPDWLTAERKEMLCDRGAAELLMPRHLFQPDLRALDLSIGTAKQLARRYQTSLVATLMRMVDLSLEDCALMVWRSGSDGRWQIWWHRSSGAWTGGFVSRERTIDPLELGIKPLQTGVIQKRMGIVPMVNEIIPAMIEVLPTNLGERACILSIVVIQGSGKAAL